MPENPRLLLAALIDRHIKARDNLEAFVERVSKAAGRPAASYRNFIWLVRAGRRPIPKGEEAAWARALGLLPDTAEWSECIKLIEGARAYGKQDGRKHLDRLETENEALRDRVATLERKLGASEAKVRALTDRIAFLEAEELQS
jgi:hypothetical protein